MCLRGTIADCKELLMNGGARLRGSNDNGFTLYLEPDQWYHVDVWEHTKDNDVVEKKIKTFLDTVIIVPILFYTLEIDLRSTVQVAGVKQPGADRRLYRRVGIATASKTSGEEIKYEHFMQQLRAYQKNEDCTITVI
ncbi:hypothetical protein N0V90_012219 [Kalmusia sp. IMI 367209]|nr:hypothetical protein N0V90_012219 [Kalmusia sp. IMI 367209]